jgi:hypothetical protein
MLRVAGETALKCGSVFGAKSAQHLFAGKNLGNALLLSDPFRRMHSRQEGKLTHRLRLLTGDRNREAKGLYRLPVFFAKLDQHIFLIGRYLGG